MNIIKKNAEQLYHNINTLCSIHFNMIKSNWKDGITISKESCYKENSSVKKTNISRTISKNFFFIRQQPF